MTLNYAGRSPVDATRSNQGRKLVPGHPETPATAAVPQMQGQASQSYPRNDDKYARANIGGGTGDDIPATKGRNP